MIKYLLAHALAGACLYAQAQDNIKTLTIGDAVPDITFTNLINYPTKTAKLSDFKGKLVILDFWATWCSACIKSFPKLNKIQTELQGSVQVLLINGQINDRGNVGKQFFYSWMERNGNTFSVPSIMEDSVLRKVFPHKYLPHCVIISPTGHIAAFMSPEIVSTSLLKEILNEETIKADLKLKKSSK